MQSNILRYLDPIFTVAKQSQQAPGNFAKTVNGGQLSGTPLEASSEKINIPPEFDGKGYISFLVHIDAEIEHGLMTQYLYAAYSLGGSQVPSTYQPQVRRWQEVILGIAKEEMGHLITCQNVLRLMGSPLHFGREDYPWDTPFYPFPFTLEPLTLNSLAKYVFVESPEGWIDSPDPIAQEIKTKMASVTHDPHRVGALFKVLLALIEDPTVVDDEVFQTRSYQYQAKFGEWGRGYSGGNRGNSSGGNPPGSPDVLVKPLLSRDDAYAALLAISEQGEAPDVDQSDGNASHFERFLTIYKEMREIMQTVGNSWQPARNLAINPYIDLQQPLTKSATTAKNRPHSFRQPITNPQAKAWAELFNLRYRMLLNYLTHTFQLDDGTDINGTKNPRGTIITATFGEMYNLRSIANVLVRLTLAPTGSTLAGPPFMMPYTLDLPMGEHNRWLLHKELIQTSERLVREQISDTENSHFLQALSEADQKLGLLIDELISHSSF